MNFSNITLTTLMAAGLAAFPQSTSTDQILQVARATWPGPHSVGVVCDYSWSKGSIDAMLDSLPPGSNVYVADTRPGTDIGKASGVLVRVRPLYVLLLPKDRLVHDGSFYAAKVIYRMNQCQIPTLATTPAALAQGAWAVMGPATGNMLQVNPTLTGYIETYGTPITPLRQNAKKTNVSTRATVSVIAAF